MAVTARDWAREHKPQVKRPEILLSQTAHASFHKAAHYLGVAAVTVSVDAQEAANLAREWDALGIPVPLVVLESPYREMNTPVVAYVRALQAAHPERLLTVYVPEFVVDHWWERLLHNQSAARLKRRLTGLPDVVVITVPWQRAEDRAAEGPTVTGGVTGMTAAQPRIDADGRPR